MKRSLLAVVLFLVASGYAGASDDDSNLAGIWAFEAEVQEGCTFAGTAELRATATPDYYVCEMMVRDFCESSPGMEGYEAIVRQSCVVTRDETDVKVNAVVEEFFQAPGATYRPDNFRLTLDPESGEMTGELDSFGIWKAKWKRSGGGLS